MANQAIKNILGNRSLTLIFLFPVLATIFLTLSGFYWGTHPFIFKNIGIHHFPNRASAPVDAHYPWIGKLKGRILTYERACVYAVEDYRYGQNETIESILPEDFSLDKFRNFVSQNANPKDRKYYLGKIDSFKIFALIDKIINFVPWDFYTLSGILLIYLYVFRHFGRRLLIIWWWYSLWAIPAVLGFYAYFYSDHLTEPFYRVMAFEDIYCKKFYEYESPWIQLFITLILIPGIVILKNVVNLALDHVVPKIKRIRDLNKF